MPNPLRGFPDLAGTVPSTAGRFFAIEVKSRRNGLRPKQRQWRADLINQGVVYILARSLDDVIEGLKRPIPESIGKTLPPRSTPLRGSPEWG